VRHSRERVFEVGAAVVVHRCKVAVRVLGSARARAAPKTFTAQLAFGRETHAFLATHCIAAARQSTSCHAQQHIENSTCSCLCFVCCSPQSIAVELTWKTRVAHGFSINSLGKVPCSATDSGRPANLGRGESATVGHVDSSTGLALTNATCGHCVLYAIYIACCMLSVVFGNDRLHCLTLKPSHLNAA
jgi:hypothetical protein